MKKCLTKQSRSCKIFTRWAFYQWLESSKDLSFLMTDKTSVRHVPVHCSSKASLSHSRAGTLWKQNITKAYESKLSTHLKHFVFAMYLENCILKIWYKVQTEKFETNIKTSEVLHESVTKQTKNKQLLIVNTINQRCNAMHLRNGKHPCKRLSRKAYSFPR